jgi:transposase-like protein
MAPRRLSENEKQDLVGRYKTGMSTAALAELFGCSPNTVTRTVKALLPPQAYAALKASRQKSGTATPMAAADPVVTAPAEPKSPVEAEQDEDNAEAVATLALDDADDFGEDTDPAHEEEGVAADDSSEASQTFTELVPLVGVADLSDRLPVEVQPLQAGSLPNSVYMLVDKVVELDARPLRDFPELGHLEEAELDRQGLFLYGNPRAAKRQCGRSQRVIKVPDTAVFERTSPYLLARGITRLVMDGSLIALDAAAQG